MFDQRSGAYSNRARAETRELDVRQLQAAIFGISVETRLCSIEKWGSQLAHGATKNDATGVEIGPEVLDQHAKIVSGSPCSQNRCSIIAIKQLAHGVYRQYFTRMSNNLRADRPLSNKRLGATLATARANRPLKLQD